LFTGLEEGEPGGEALVKGLQAVLVALAVPQLDGVEPARRDGSQRGEHQDQRDSSCRQHRRRRRRRGLWRLHHGYLRTEVLDGLDKVLAVNLLMRGVL